jgi:hypothetical protein
MFARVIVITLMFMISFYYISPCVNPVDCYEKAIEILNKDREELKKAIELFKGEIADSKAEEIKKREEMQNTINSLTNEIQELKNQKTKIISINSSGAFSSTINVWTTINGLEYSVNIEKPAWIEVILFGHGNTSVGGRLEVSIFINDVQTFLGETISHDPEAIPITAIANKQVNKGTYLIQGKFRNGNQNGFVVNIWQVGMEIKIFYL